MTAHGFPSSRAYNLATKYGMDERDFDELMHAQGGRCAICRSQIDAEMVDKRGVEKSIAHVDHDHTTDEVRGLLCGNCNTGLGMFKDSVRMLANAIVYLEDHGKSFS